MAKRATLYAIHADNPDALLACLGEMLGANGTEQAGAPVLCITMPCCDATKVYRQLKDVPRENVGPCKCGNWFLYYKEAPT